MSINRSKLFLSSDNKNTVLASLYTIHKQHNFDMPVGYFVNKVSKKMEEWAISKKLDDMECLGPVDYYLESLDFINRLFIKEYTQAMTLETPTQNWIPDAQMPINKISLTKANKDEWATDKDYVVEDMKLKDMMASDYGSIGVWGSTDVSFYNKNFRKTNKIQKDQISRHARHYDRYHDEGFRNTQTTSSMVNNHQRGYGVAYQEFIKNVTNDKSRNIDF